MQYLIAIQRSKNKPFLRIMQLPRGPTFNFQIINYATCSLLSHRLGNEFNPF